MDRSFGWLISIGLHVALLLGLTLVVVDRYVLASGSVGIGVDCAIVERLAGIPRIEQPREFLGSKIESPDPPPFLDDRHGQGSRPGFLVPWTTVTIEEGESWCASCLREFRQGVGCIRWVVLAKTPPMPEPLRGYAYRKQSLQENRVGMPRLTRGIVTK